MIKFATQYKTTEETLSTDTKKDLHVGLRPLVFLGPPSWPWNIFWNTRFVQRNCFLYFVFFISFSLFCLYVCSFVFFSMQWFFCLWLVLKLTQPLHLVRYKSQTTCNSDLVIVFSQACGQLIEFTLNGHLLFDLYLFSLHD